MSEVNPETPVTPEAAAAPEPNVEAAPVSEELQRYRAFRDDINALNRTLFDKLPTDVFNAAVVRLGSQSRRTKEQNYFEMAACLDLALFQTRIAGKPLLEQMLAAEAIAPGSPVAAAADVLRQSRYTIFHLASRGDYSIEGTDVLRDEKIKVFDETLPKFEGFEFFAARLIPWEGAWSLHGASIPMRIEGLGTLLRSLTPILGKRIKDRINRLTPEKQSDLVALIQRRGLEDLHAIRMGF